MKQLWVAIHEQIDDCNNYCLTSILMLGIFCHFATPEKNKKIQLSSYGGL